MFAYVLQKDLNKQLNLVCTASKIFYKICGKNEAGYV